MRFARSLFCFPSCDDKRETFLEGPVIRAYLWFFGTFVVPCGSLGFPGFLSLWALVTDGSLDARGSPVP